MKLESSAFADGSPIPKKHTADGPDLSPPLAWSDVPAGTQCFALLCDDPELFEVGRHFGELLAPKLENEVFIFQNEDIATNWLKA